MGEGVGPCQGVGEWGGSGLVLSLGGEGFDFFCGGFGGFAGEVEVLGVEGGLGVGEAEGFEGFEDDFGDGEVAEPLVVGGDDKPGGVLVGGAAEDVLVGVHVSGPEDALFEVEGIELPVLVGVVDAGLEAAGLFFVRDVEEELEDEDVAVGEGLLPGVDVVHAAVGLFAGDEAVDAGGEHILIVRAVEDADHAAGGSSGLAAPEELVAGFERGGDFEGGDVAALGIDAGEDVADGAVFASRVHALEDDEQSFGLGGVEDFLELIELGGVGGGDGLGGGLIGNARVGAGGQAGELELGARLDEEGRVGVGHGCPALFVVSCQLSVVSWKWECERRERLSRGALLLLAWVKNKFGLGGGGLDVVGGLGLGRDGVGVGLGSGGGVLADALHAFLKAAQAFADSLAEFGKFFAAEEQHGKAGNDDEVPRLKEISHTNTPRPGWPQGQRANVPIVARSGPAYVYGPAEGMDG
jgi:hypothetical protein